MVPNIGWSRSRRWLLETCARRYVLTYLVKTVGPVSIAA